MTAITSTPFTNRNSVLRSGRGAYSSAAPQPHRWLAPVWIGRIHCLVHDCNAS